MSKAIVILYRVRYNKNVVKEQKKKPKPKGKEEFIMKKELNEFVYNDGEVFVGATKAGTMVFDPEQPAWVFTLAVDGAEPVSYDDDLEWALDELRDDLLSDEEWTFEHDGEEYRAEFDDPDGMVLRFTDSQDNFLGTLSAGTSEEQNELRVMLTLGVDPFEEGWEDGLNNALVPEGWGDDRIIKMWSKTDKSWEREFSTTWDGAQIAVDLIEELGGIEPKDGKLIPNHGDFVFPNPDEDEKAYDEAYRAASEELMTYYDSLSLTEVADEIANITGKSARVYYWVEEN
ncbi:hypothetical protein [Ligilactobacillus ruminis]|uniref:hypothetical protein n=1 Tax=Ligilactobacillus ruminis TaxID=1623 RepID=UPI0022E5A070|nr:hypothetical protein [Ligilactobacillus ruminis]